jgi:LPXTG-site transpeptidase (sortase) family protein
MSKLKIVLAAGVLLAAAYVVKTSGGAGTPAPEALRIPAIGVDSVLVDLAVDKSGALVPPRSADVLGWYADGVAPGDAGPAVIAGHVDSKTGPGVFEKLATLKAGDQVFVERNDGSVVTFVVGKTYAVAKTAFPTDLVYSPTPVSELRLVTCGGTFDTAADSYRDNVVVEAVLAG